MNRVFRNTGIAASLLAMLLVCGGHWMVLQSIAWTRMLIVNSRSDTLPVAMSKTFDGKHPCKMCHQIREGRDAERHESSIASGDHAPRPWLALADGAPKLSIPPDRAVGATTPNAHADFLGTPPEPPPRAA
ncbi:MAG TPA: hypothetical protein VFO62_07860 [Candidatus Binatia bacterium]|nr:hypothetical protein [Candidatus Binatia bacterium]